VVKVGATCCSKSRCLGESWQYCSHWTGQRRLSTNAQHLAWWLCHLHNATKRGCPTMHTHPVICRRSPFSKPLSPPAQATGGLHPVKFDIKQARRCGLHSNTMCTFQRHIGPITRNKYSASFLRPWKQSHTITQIHEACHTSTAPSLRQKDTPPGTSQHSVSQQATQAQTSCVAQTTRNLSCNIQAGGCVMTVAAEAAATCGSGC